MKMSHEEMLGTVRNNSPITTFVWAAYLYVPNTKRKTTGRSFRDGNISRIRQGFISYSHPMIKVGHPNQARTVLREKPSSREE